MSEQALIQFRADRQLCDEVAQILDSVGVDMSTALQLFLKKIKKVGRLPFDDEEYKKEMACARAMRVFEEIRKQTADLPEMTMEEIDAEIAAARAERRAGKAAVA